jgi:glutamate-ammonia-ligase adenylyltransferase
VTIRTLWPVVVAEFAESHGDPPGRGAAVIGMGSLGAGLLTPSSDLDLIVVYDAEGDARSAGRRPLAARLYYARLTQALVTALGAPTAAGKLYEVDMRLRPSGRQGPIATSLAAFETYQREEAWTWEHLALTRARVVAGDAGPGTAVTRFLEALLDPARPPDPILRDTADMRRRLTEAHGATGPWEAKRGPGRTLDIELAAAAATLVGAGWPRALRDQLAASNLFDAEEVETLAAAHALLWSVQAAARLLGGSDPSAALAEAPLIRRITGERSANAAARRLEGQASAAARVIDGVFAAKDAGDGSRSGGD